MRSFPFINNTTTHCTGRDKVPCTLSFFPRNCNCCKCVTGCTALEKFYNYNRSQTNKISTCSSYSCKPPPLASSKTPHSADSLLRPSLGTKFHKTLVLLEFYKTGVCMHINSSFLKLKFLVWIQGLKMEFYPILATHYYKILQNCGKIHFDWIFDLLFLAWIVKFQSTVNDFTNLV